MVEDDAVPEIVVVALHVWPVTVVWLIVSVAEIDAPTANESSPDGPLAAVHVPLAFVPVWVSCADTVSVTVAPPVWNCQVPLQEPATSMRLGARTACLPGAGHFMANEADAALAELIVTRAF